MVKKFLLVLILLFCLPACTPDPNDQFIQGTWVFANEFENERSGPAHVLQSWSFEEGFFFFQQEVAFGFPILIEGRYRILESQAEKIVLELYLIESSGPVSDPSELTITVDREENTARINRVLYERPE